ncbi:succinate-semialdehyde dehydrogenase [NADP+] GabD, partial [Vibrio parahaemolyticus EKP-008]
YTAKCMTSSLLSSTLRFNNSKSVTAWKRA